MPRVSILLTSYNHRSYIEEAVASVRAQTFHDYELIALDDGSTDGTREWLSEQSGLRCVFNERNLGTYATLNEGLARSDSEFVAILNDDDVWRAPKLAAQLTLLRDHPKVGLVHTGGRFIDGSGKQIQGNPLGFRFPTFETGDLLLGLIYENKIIASAALARRECFDRLGGFDSSYFGSGDWQMWYRIAEEYLVGMVQEPYTDYRVHGANASHKLEKIWKDDEMLRLWILERTERLTNRFSPQEVKRAVSFNYAALGTVQMLNGSPNYARTSFSNSIRQDPLRLKSYLRYLATYLPVEIFRKSL